LDCKIIIVGGGIIGLSIAKSLYEKCNDIYIIEKESNVGLGISSRNSEVIHSGIYYPINSLKTKLCIKGRKMLYKYCNDYNVKYNKCGKLLIGHTISDYNKLLKIKNNTKKNNINSKLLNKEEINNLEPNVSAKHALYFPESGVIDSHELIKKIYNEIRKNNVSIAFKTEVVKISKLHRGYDVLIKNHDGTKNTIKTEILINAAGLYSNNISTVAGISNPDYELSYWKGEYCWVANNDNLVKSLIYPLPETNIAGLGVHTTIDINNRLRLGPNAIYMGQNLIEDYTISESIINSFYESVNYYIPKLKLEDIYLDQSGIRPKLQKPGEPFRDFIIKNESSFGYKNFINLIGIESPGLTSALAIGEYVKQLIKW